MKSSDNSDTSSSINSSENGFGFNSRLFFLSASIICFIILSIVFLMLFLHFVLKENETTLEICIKSEECPEVQIPVEVTIPKNITCMTKECTLTAATLISAMDPTVDPCEDFYQFSCANYIRKNHVPENMTKISVVYQYSNNNFILQLKDLIENYDPYGQPDVVSRLKESYYLCINTSQDRRKELTAFMDYIDNVLSGWPMAQGNHWKPNQKRFSNYLKDLTTAGVKNGIIEIEAEKIYNAPFTHQLKVSMPKLDQTFLKLNPNKELELNGQTEKSVNDEKGVALKKLLITLLKFFGQTNTTFIDNEIKKISNFIIYMDEIFKNTSLSQPLFNNMTIEGLNILTGYKIDWLQIAKTKFGNKYIFSDQIKIVRKDLLSYLPTILTKFSRRTISNFIVWNAIFPDLLKIAGPEVENLYEEYSKVSNGNTIKPIRWKYCIHWIEEIYPLVLTRMYVKEYVDNRKEIVDEMMDLILQAYKISINESDWLDDTTKKRALDKADAIRRLIGYPEFIFNDEAIEEEYSYIPVVKSSHFRNKLEIDNQIKGRKRDLYSANKNNKWFHSLSNINTYYISSENSIWFPPGMLQLPFFDPNRLAAINFGTVGTLIAHEIGHVFDKKGSSHNERGDLENWWSDASYTEFLNRMDCFIGQYNEYCPEELQHRRQNDRKICVPGSITQTESGADNMGLKMAFLAYKLWIEKYGEEERLPGLEEYSPEQLFFINFTYLWCENIPPDKWEKMYEKSPHTAGRFRSIGSLANSEEFRETFNCQLTNIMNRGNESCSVW